jgi:hypothetical protein
VRIRRMKITNTKMLTSQLFVFIQSRILGITASARLRNRRGGDLGAQQPGDQHRDRDARHGGDASSAGLPPPEHRSA